MLLSDGQDNLVSVVMAVYNGEKYVAKAIDSVLNQTYSNFELLVINDGSTDATEKVINTYRSHAKVRIVSRKNLGLVATLNEGIRLSNGMYIMRMDADDICMPHRMETQVRFLTEHQLDLVGSSIKTFGNYINQVRKFPVEDAAIRFSLLFASCFAHPTILAKKEMLLQNPYDSDFDKIEDYEMWTRLAAKGYKLGNCPDVLLLYRVHAKQISSANRNHQDNRRIEIAKRYATHFFGPEQDSTILDVLLNRNYTTLHKVQIVELNRFYNYLQTNFPQYKPVVSYQFFLCFLHNFFKNGEKIIYLKNEGFIKRNLIRICNHNRITKKVPADMYRLLC
ncbi:MAG: glycosyl transferase family 2 [Flavisolibacter sp.]|nr:glycosyl transferase family 2 [Flavisolibacter sp.]